eukprot:m.178544 g.178544  ORF g.178544 m.178544 type:complete len:397 (-) comp17396_c0_seq1:114-1304(-)
MPMHVGTLVPRATKRMLRMGKLATSRLCSRASSTCTLPPRRRGSPSTTGTDALVAAVSCIFSMWRLTSTELLGASTTAQPMYSAVQRLCARRRAVCDSERGLAEESVPPGDCTIMLGPPPALPEEECGEPPAAAARRSLRLRSADPPCGRIACCSCVVCGVCGKTSASMPSDMRCDPSRESSTEFCEARVALRSASAPLKLTLRMRPSSSCCSCCRGEGECGRGCSSCRSVAGWCVCGTIFSDPNTLADLTCGGDAAACDPLPSDALRECVCPEPEPAFLGGVVVVVVVAGGAEADAGEDVRGGSMSALARAGAPVPTTRRAAAAAAPSTAAACSTCCKSMAETEAGLAERSCGEEVAARTAAAAVAAGSPAPPPPVVASATAAAAEECCSDPPGR